jgi:hypothetical protein
VEPSSVAVGTKELACLGCRQVAVARGLDHRQREAVEAVQVLVGPQLRELARARVTRIPTRARPVVADVFLLVVQRHGEHAAEDRLQVGLPRRHDGQPRAA